MFGSFGGNTSDKIPLAISTNSPRSFTAPASIASTLSKPSNGPTNSKMVARVPDAVTSEMEVRQAAQVLSGNLLEKIGAPDHAGWMMKKGEKYNSWKERYFVLKGLHLYYLKSETVRLH
jgi:hypothetical protein